MPNYSGSGGIKITNAGAFMSKPTVVENPTIAISFVHAMLEPTRRRGIAIGPLLDGAAIPPALLKAEKARVTAQQFAQLSNAVAVQLNDESFGHHKRPQKPGTFNALARYLINSETLGEAIERNVEFHNLFDPGFQLQLCKQGSQTVYRLVPDDDWLQSPYVCEQTLMINYRFLCWLCGNCFALERVNFNYPEPAYKAEYHYMFFCPIQFEQRFSEMIFDTRHLQLPVVRSQADLAQFLNNSTLEFVRRPASEKSYAEQIRRLLRKSLPAMPDYEDIAAMMKVNPQTLRRRLRIEGCDFRQLRNELIRDMAISYLTREDMEIKEIAYLLGFSEPSAFIRSFRKWTDTTPGCYRSEFVARREGAG